MRVWIFKLSEFTPWDCNRDGVRKFRYSMLSKALVAAGHQVLWWTDDFQHYKKEEGHRFGRDHYEQVSLGIAVRWIHSPGYRRNVSVRRFWDHRIVAVKMLKDADNWPRPDLILSGMPTDTMCEVAVELGEKFGVPVVLDVRDQWPDIFFSQVPAIARPLIRLVTMRMNRRIHDSFSKASAIVGNTDAFVDWGLKKGRRERSQLDRAFPIGYSKMQDSKYDCPAAERFWRGLGVCRDDNSFKICFLGSFSKMYDFNPIFEAASEMESDQVAVKFILCGDGPDLRRFQKAAEHLPNVIFAGRISGNEIHALLSMSSVGIIPYINHDNFGNNIANKPAEYLSADLPILISVGGILADFLVAYECGNQYEGSDDLIRKIRNLRDDRDLLAKMRVGASRLFSEKLDADKIYQEFTEHLEFVESS